MQERSYQGQFKVPPLDEIYHLKIVQSFFFQVGTFQILLHECCNHCTLIEAKRR